jgi:hypothetical protein
MRGRGGRKSAASLAVVNVLGNERPAPPDDLSETEAKEWREIAGRMPHDWFTRENHPLLAEYCRHIVRARDLAQDIAKFKQFPASDPTEFQQDVWRRTVAGEASTFFKTAALQVAHQASDISKRYHPTSDMLRARPGGTHGPPGGI